MNLWPALALIAVTAIWFLLPLVPAFLELLRPTDINPLAVVPRDAGDVGYLARGFRRYLRGQLERLPAETPGDFLGRLPDGTHFARIREGVGVLAASPEQDRVVVVETDVAVPGERTFLQEIHAHGSFSGGSAAVYRAILGDGRIVLGDGSRVLRWIHAAGPIEVGRGSVLQGRTSSDKSVLLDAGVSFDRIGAPEISIRGAAPPADPPRSRSPFKTPEGATRVGDHLRVDGDLVVPADSEIEGNLVVKGSLTLGRGTMIRGSIKAHGAIALEDGTDVRGSVVGRDGIRIGAHAFVAGPVIGEGAVEVGGAAVIGTAGAPTTISADRIVLGAGTSVFGQIATRNGGSTVG